jgi:hypothetical protein
VAADLFSVLPAAVPDLTVPAAPIPTVEAALDLVQQPVAPIVQTVTDVPPPLGPIVAPIAPVGDGAVSTVTAPVASIPTPPSLSPPSSGGTVGGLQAIIGPVLDPVSVSPALGGTVPVLEAVAPCLCSTLAAVTGSGPSDSRASASRRGSVPASSLQAQAAEPRSESGSVQAPASDRFLKSVDAVSDIRVGGRQIGSGGRAQPVVSADNRGDFFGWFGSFMAFTGANLLRMIQVGLAALLLGTPAVVVHRRRRRLQML